MIRKDNIKYIDSSLTPVEINEIVMLMSFASEIERCLKTGVQLSATEEQSFDINANGPDTDEVDFSSDLRTDFWDVAANADNLFKVSREVQNNNSSSSNPTPDVSNENPSNTNNE